MNGKTECNPLIPFLYCIVLKAAGNMTLIAPGKALDLKDYTLTACKEGASWLRDYITAIKNGQYHPFTKLERKAREATRNEPWYVQRNMIQMLES